MVLPIDFTKKTVAVVTGASAGIGRAIALQLAALLSGNSTIVLIARSEKRLAETKSLIVAINSELIVKIHSVDLSTPDLATFENVLRGIGGDTKLALIFHNAGQVGKLNKAADLTEVQVWKEYYDLNVISTFVLNAAFMKEVKCDGRRLVVVNVTSLCGRKPFHSLAMYGSAKAARDLYFRVLAEEESKIAVLNYSPGPVHTDMFEEIVANMAHEESRAIFIEMRDSKTVLTPAQTVEKMMGILKAGNFQSGDVVDYYDV